MMWRALLLGFLLLPGTVAHAQTFQFQGGDSTLFNAAGGSLTMFTPSTTTTLGAGIFDGHFRAGGDEESSWHGWDFIAGDHELFLTAGNAGFATASRGLFAQRKIKHQTFAIFVGTAGQLYSVPFFESEVAHNFGTALFYQRTFGKLVLTGVGAIAGNKRTGIAAADYKWRWVKLTGDDGVLQNARFENGQVQVQPFHFASAELEHTTYVFNGETAATNDAGAAIALGAASLNASVFDSRYGASESYGAGLRLGPVQITGNEFSSRAQRTVSANISERLSWRLTTTEYVDHSNGQWSASVGGQFSGNVISAGLSYQEMYFPFLPATPFQRVAEVHLTLQLPHSANVTASNSVLPTGQSRWSVYGGAYAAAHLLPTVSTPSSPAPVRKGKYIITGTVVDASGSPVEGAAVSIGGTLVFTDSSGAFFLRVRKDTSTRVLVSLADFTAPGTWRVVSAPACVVPGNELRIVVTH
jgi:hypothetical protein